MTANTTFVSGAILTAAQMNALPWGVVDATAGGTSGRGFVNKTTNQTITTTEADVTGQTVTWTAVTGRLYRLSFSCRYENGGTAQKCYVRITTGANVVVLGTATSLIASGEAQVNGMLVISGLTGTQTYKMRALTQSANATIIGNSGDVFGFVVEDIGPST
jgi:hypothetical protein